MRRVAWHRALPVAVLAWACGETPPPAPTVAMEPARIAPSTPASVDAPAPASRPRLPTRGAGGAPVADAATRQAALAETIRARTTADQAARAELDRRATAPKGAGSPTESQPAAENNAGDGPTLAIAAAGFEPQGDGIGLRVRATANLGEGGLVDVLATYAGEPVPALRRRGTIRDGHVEVVLGPVRGHLSSGVYDVSLTLDPARQTAALRLALVARFGSRAPSTSVVVRQSITLRQPELTSDERRTAIDHYTLVAAGARTLQADLARVALGQHAPPAAEVAERRDATAFAAWQTAWRARVGDLRRAHEAFATRFATAPHPRLVGRMDVLLAHLARLGDMRGREIARAHPAWPVEVGEHREVGEGFVTPADLERSIAQVLVELDGVITGATDEPTAARALVASLTRLAAGPDYGDETRLGPRVERYTDWSNQLERATGGTFTPHWDPLCAQADRVRIALAAAHGRALVAWIEEHRHAVPPSLEPLRHATATEPASAVARLENVLARVLATAPSPTAPARDDAKVPR